MIAIIENVISWQRYLFSISDPVGGQFKTAVETGLISVQRVSAEPRLSENAQIFVTSCSDQSLVAPLGCKLVKLPRR
jgi:hypothetical protein